MPKEEWGVKRICPTTGRPFYDLGKTPIVSPYTGETVTLDANARTRLAVEEKPVVKDDDDEDDILLDDEDDGDDDDAKIDDSLLDDDEEDNVSLDEIKNVPADDDDS